MAWGGQSRKWGRRASTEWVLSPTWVSEPKRGEVGIAKGGPPIMVCRRPGMVGGHSHERVDSNGVWEPRKGERTFVPLRQPLGEEGLPCEIGNI